MKHLFADRINDVPRSFIREILKVAIDPDIISFAGGLPNRDFFPVKALQEATNKIFHKAGKDVMQYSNSEGYEPLRKFIADRYYKKQGLKIDVNHILITSGSQQGLDLLGKTLLNDGDEVVIEEPGYLGAIQAFALFKSRFKPVPLLETGLDLVRLKAVLKNNKPKLMYTVPNFQNPSGISYSEKNRQAIAGIVGHKRILLVEDDSYGDLNFEGKSNVSFKSLLTNQTVLLGSFSKTIVPGFRLGWIVASDPLMDKLIIAKQASDLHTNYLVQRVVYQYLQDNDFDQHIATILAGYRRQCMAMIKSIDRYFPKAVTHTIPEGGMFLWVMLPKGASSLRLFDLAIKQKVAFVPGNPFYVRKKETNTLRLNFSCVDEATIEIGIKRLANAMKALIEL